MTNEFHQITQDISALFLWHKEIGIQHLDLSEESLNILDNLIVKQKKEDINIPNNIKNFQYKQSTNTTEIKHFSQIEVDNIRDKSAANNTKSQIVQITNSVNLNDSINFDGNINSQLFFFSESFKYTEPTGELFIKILKSMNLKSENICLCRFEPLNYKVDIPKLRQQIKSITKKVEQSIYDIKIRSGGSYPQIICTLGDSALKILMGMEYLLTDARGRLYNYNGIRLIPTYHPLQILNDITLKRLVWEDIKQIIRIMMQQQIKY